MEIKKPLKIYSVLSFSIFLLVLLNSNIVCAKVAEIDSNFDGQMDQWIHTGEDGKVFKIEHDTLYCYLIKPIRIY